jgi:hypothetical protein
MNHPRRSLRTILIASASSAGAAVVVRTLWAPGTVFSAALMPLLVAIFDELLYWHTEYLSYLARERLAGRVPSAAEALRGRVSLGDRARVRRVIVITATAFLIGGAALTAAELLAERVVTSVPRRVMERECHWPGGGVLRHGVHLRTSQMRPSERLIHQKINSADCLTEATSKNDRRP